LDIAQEISNHLEWMEKIVSLLDSEAVSRADLDAITQHDQCALGQWLGTEGAKQFGDLPEFTELDQSHAAFHQQAGKLITALREGHEEDALASQAAFIKLSKQVIGNLLVLQEKGRT